MKVQEKSSYVSRTYFKVCGNVLRIFKFYLNVLNSKLVHSLLLFIEKK